MRHASRRPARRGRQEPVGALLPQNLSATPAYVQSNAALPQTSQATVTVAYPAAQTAGDLNIVIVGWNDTTNLVSAVTDTVGNKYLLAVGPTKRTTALSQSIYYAKSIAAAPAGGAKLETVSAVQPTTAVAESTAAADQGDTLGDSARRAKQHKACLDLAKDNPSIVCK